MKNNKNLGIFMRKLFIILFISIMFSSLILTGSSRIVSNTEKKGNNQNVPEQLKYQNFRVAINNTDFNGSVTILLSSSLYWLSKGTLDLFINDLNQSVKEIFPKVNLEFRITTSLMINDVITDMNNDTTIEREYLISVGRNQRISINENIIKSVWTNQSYYSHNNSVFSHIAFIDSNVRLENYSYQDFDQVEAGFLAGAWSAFSSIKQYAGILMVPGPELGFKNNNPFTIMNSEFLSGIFTGIEHVREKYLNRNIFPVVAKGMDQTSFIVSMTQSFTDLNLSNVINFSPDSALSEGKNSANKMINKGIDSLISISNSGDNGIAEVIQENDNTFGFFLNSQPIEGTNRAAFLYPNYTLATLKQLENWAQMNESNLIQNVYKPNTAEYLFENRLSDLDNNDDFQNLLINLSESNIEISGDFISCEISFNGCKPSHLEIISGLEWFSVMVLLLAGIFKIKRSKRTN